MDYFHKFKQEAKERIDNLTIEQVAEWLCKNIDEKMIVELLKKDVDNVEKIKTGCVMCGKIQWQDECEHDYEICENVGGWKKCKKCGLVKRIEENCYE